MADIMNYLYGPLSKEYCLYFYFLSVVGFLSMFVFLAFPIAIYPVQKLGRRMRKVTGDAQEELSNYTARLDETFHSIKIIKSFCAEKLESLRAKEITTKILSFYKLSYNLYFYIYK